MTRTIESSTTGRREPCCGCAAYAPALAEAAADLRDLTRERGSWIALAVGARLVVERRAAADAVYGVALERRERALVCAALDGLPVNLHAIESDARRDIVEAIVAIRTHGLAPTRDRVVRVVAELARARAHDELDAVVEFTLEGAA